MDPRRTEEHEAQLERFDRLRHELSGVLQRLRSLDDDTLVRPDWRARNRDLERHLLPLPPPDFLRHPAILYQMFVDSRHLAAELPYVTARLPTLDLAAEDPVGDPVTTPLAGAGVVTSANTVHHLHHLLRFEESTGVAIADLDVVVEWGGGYGNLAKLLRRLHGGAPTYVVFDTPVFSGVQWLYLASVLGDDAVLLHDRPGRPVARGKVNVVPAGAAAALDVDADLFVSTWALNESPSRIQALVEDRRWFGARSLLLGMHRGDPLEEVVRSDGARAEPVVDTMPGQLYLVR